ncbi:MAG: shikimate dehydrogenase [Verrucomicrobiota bacterium]
MTPEVKDVYTLESLEELRGEKNLYGVIGYPIEHSLSPDMHNAAFEKLGLEAKYVRIELKPEELKEGLKAMKAIGFKGWNATLPHKVELLDLIDESSENAQIMRAVNTVVHEEHEDKLIGFNTDGEGWVRAIREEFFVDIKDLRIMILGAGGAGQSLATQAALECCERLVLVNRTEEKARRFVSLIDHYFDDDRVSASQERIKVLPFDESAIAEELNTIDLIVNCTSKGLKSYDGAVLPGRIIQPHHFVYDTIYKPAQTHFLQEAAEAHAKTANGLSMLLHQGILSFEIWTGKTAPVSEMRATLKEAIQRSDS